MSDTHRAVFLSYASQDAEAARRICEALRAAGIVVWFDQSELRGGDAWDQKIRKQIKECALFVPVISANTQARREGYFRLEWRLADQRTHMMGRSGAFMMPVCVDGTKDANADVPDSFLAVQWTRIASGDSLDAFCERVKTLLAEDVAPVSDRRSANLLVGTGSHLAKPSPRRWVIPAAAVGLLAVVLGIWTFYSRRGGTSAPHAPHAETVEESAGVRQLLGRVAAIIDQEGDATRDELTLAEEMAAQATKLEPQNADAWVAYAYAGIGLYDYYFDRARDPLGDATTRARRALALAPDSDESKLVLASCFARRASAFATAATRPEARQMLRELIQRRPQDPRVLRTLAGALRDDATAGEANAAGPLLDEAIALLDRAASVAGNRAGPWLEKARMLQMTNRDAEADAAIDKALALNAGPSAQVQKLQSLALVHGDYAAAETILRALPGSYYLREDICEIASRVWLWQRNPDQCLRVLNGWKEDFLGTSPTRFLAGQAWLLKGRPELARDEWERALQAVEVQIAAKGLTSATANFGWRARLLALLGRLPEAEQAMREHEARSTGPRRGYFQALVQLALGRIEPALAKLELVEVTRLRGDIRQQALRMWAELRSDPAWDPLRGQPKFEAHLALLKRELEGSSSGAAGSQVQSSVPLNPISADSKSVAVLAFANLSEDKDNEYFSDGISEELLNVLAKVPGLKVSARTSAFSFKGKGVAIPEIAKQLGVAYVVEGSVRKAGNRVRITAQLIKASDGFHVWSDNFDRELKDIFAVQDEIAGLIAQKLSLNFGLAAGPPAKPVNPEAYQLYLQSRRVWNVTDAGNREAEQLLQRALALEPNFAKAHAALSDVWRYQVQMDPGAATFAQRDGPGPRRLIDAAQRAVNLDPALAEARQALGAAYWMSWRFDDAERELRQAVALNSNYAVGRQLYGRVLMTLGRVDEGIAELRRAVELDPLSSRIADNCCSALLNAGLFEEALSYANRALSLESANDQAMGMKAEILANLGRREEAATLARSLVEMGPVRGGLMAGNGRAGLVFALVGQQAEAEDILARGNERQWWVFAALGRYEECLAAFSTDPVSAQGVELLYYRPIFDPIRRDPRFVKLLRDQGVLEAHDRAQAWRASFAKPTEAKAANQAAGDRRQGTGKEGLPSVGSAKEGSAK